MSNIGTMTIDFAASVARLEADVKRGADATEAGVKRMSDAAGLARTMFETLGVTLSVGALASYINGAIQAADATNDLRQQLGFSARELTAYRLIAEQSGTTIDGFAGGMKKLSVFLTDNGDKLRAAGITATDTNGAFLQLADLFATMPDGAQKTALAMEVFGKSGADLIPTLNQGGEALREQLDAGLKLNPVIDELATRADQFNDSLARLRAASTGSASVIANELLKVLNVAIEDFGEATASSDGFAHSVGTGLAETLKTVLVLGGNVSYVFQGIGREIGGMAAQMAALARGDFAAFTEIGRLLREDAAAARIDIDAWSEKIMNGAAAAGSAGGGRAAGEARARAQDAAARAAAALLGGGAKAPKGDGKDDSKRADDIEREAFRRSERELQRLMAEDEKEAEREVEQRSRHLASLAQRTADIAAGFLSEQEQEAMFHSTRMETLMAMQGAANTARADDAQAQLESDMYYHGLMEQEKERHLLKLGDDEAKAAKARKDFAALTAMQQASLVAGTLTSHLALASQKYRAFFYIHKLASMAQAYINTAEGVTKALSWGPIGLGIAPVIAAAGAANIAIIAAQKFEGPGGGSPGSVGGGYSAPITGPGGYSPPEAPGAASQALAAGPAREINLTIIGKTIDLKTMTDEFLPALEEAIGNGAGNLRFVVNQG